jgi:DNA-binding response OmpR family regulator
MNLQALVLCSDEKIVRVLRRVLNDLEIAVDQCPDTELAVQKLSRRRFESVIVDCTDPEMASQILKAARNAPSNKKAVAVAIIDSQSDVRSAFELGAHFVLYKPISAERAKASFRAARALMKCERRRACRIPVEMPVMYRFKKNSDSSLERTVSSDLSEDGIGVRLARRHHERGPMHLQFKLPGSNRLIEADAELAWENPNGQAGIRFSDLPDSTRQALKAWLKTNSPDAEDDDPPAKCKLTDLSLGGCYLETNSPFPVRARVELNMRVGELEVHATGVVRVMHPDVGMGVVFTQKTDEQRANVEKFIHGLMESNGMVPELLVEPDGLEPFSQDLIAPKREEDAHDPLVELFQTKAFLPTMEFLQELRKQRRTDSETVDATEPILPA